MCAISRIVELVIVRWWLPIECTRLHNSFRYAPNKMMKLHEKVYPADDAGDDDDGDNNGKSLALRCTNKTR